MTRTDYAPSDFATDDPEAARAVRLNHVAMVAALACFCAWCAPQPYGGKVKAMIHTETSESAFRRGPTEYAAETLRRVRLLFGPIGGDSP